MSQQLWNTKCESKRLARMPLVSLWRFTFISSRFNARSMMLNLACILMIHWYKQLYNMPGFETNRIIYGLHQVLEGSSPNASLEDLVMQLSEIQASPGNSSRGSRGKRNAAGGSPNRSMGGNALISSSSPTRRESKGLPRDDTGPRSPRQPQSPNGGPVSPLVTFARALQMMEEDSISGAYCYSLSFTSLLYFSVFMNAMIVGSKWGIIRSRWCHNVPPYFPCASRRGGKVQWVQWAGPQWRERAQR